MPKKCQGCKPEDAAKSLPGAAKSLLSAAKSLYGCHLLSLSKHRHILAGYRAVLYVQHPHCMHNGRSSSLGCSMLQQPSSSPGPGCLEAGEQQRKCAPTSASVAVRCVGRAQTTAAPRSGSGTRCRRRRHTAQTAHWASLTQCPAG